MSVDYRSVANWSSCSNPGGQRIGKPTVDVGQAVPDAVLRVRHSLTYGNLLECRKHRCGSTDDGIKYLKSLIDRERHVEIA